MQHFFFLSSKTSINICVFRHCEGLPNVWCTVDQESVEQFCPGWVLPWPSSSCSTRGSWIRGETHPFLFKSKVKKLILLTETSWPFLVGGRREGYDHKLSMYRTSSGVLSTFRDFNIHYHWTASSASPMQNQVFGYKKSLHKRRRAWWAEFTVGSCSSSAGGF